MGCKDSLAQTIGSWAITVMLVALAAVCTVVAVSILIEFYGKVTKR